MIRNDLKELLPSNWRSIFSHRTCDPENYEVGVFNINSTEKILVLNPDTLDIMEYFYDDVPNDKWISLKHYFIRDGRFNSLDISKNDYFINKKYELKSSRKIRNILKVKVSHRRSYPELSINKKIVKIHKLLSIIFIPNPKPDKYNIINHIDLNKLNFHLNNLEWCDAKYNNSALNRKSIVGQKFIYYQYDKNGNLLRIFNNTKELKQFYPGYRKCLDNGKTRNGFYFERKSILALDYIKKHPIIENGWYTNNYIKSHKVEANLCGILRVNGKLALGVFDEVALTYRIKINNKNILVHRLVYETISGKLIPQNMVIDHIIPSSFNDVNNEFSNLKLCSQKENINNPFTKRKISIQCSLFDFTGKLIKHYDSLTEAKKDLKISKLNKNYNIIKNTYIFLYDIDLNKLDDIIKNLGRP